ncbi:hypothetical protein BCR33DRAFT_849077 [Rhizoclosmatium globosum]|uniref:Uncharacterized protein n=1 Tax=Rhizoclosmatium globosum TaxID=329046 RepID=A0A1Y2CHL7_9FUNG|nr:hypothetical protein BCR33DRAFT_849077 [Rhizoclosmatium globosum]|eukprot:ORY46324.1 hypothetical protein BCR33DRAFT_849077 [Rhizoclosmatium globosum]
MIQTEPETSNVARFGKIAVSLGSAAVFGGILFTMKMRSQGKMELPIAKLMETSHAARAADPKLAAYLFAGRAFMTGTALTLSASLAVTMALKEFSYKMKLLSNNGMPSLKGQYSDNHDNEVDDAAYEFALAWKEELRKEAEEGSGFKDNRYHQEIRARVKKELGPFAQ